MYVGIKDDIIVSVVVVNNEFDEQLKKMAIENIVIKDLL